MPPAGDLLDALGGLATEASVFGDLGATLGSEYGAIGEAAGRAAGSALDRLVDQGMGLLKDLAAGGRQDYPREELYEDGYQQAIASQTTGRLRRDLKYYAKPLKDSEHTVWWSGYHQAIADHSFEQIGFAPRLENYEKIAAAAKGSRSSRAVAAGLQSLQNLSDAQEKLGQQSIRQEMEELAKRIEAENVIKVRRNRARLAASRGKTPKLGPFRAAKWAKRNYAIGLADGLLPPEWSSRMPRDVLSLADAIRPAVVREILPDERFSPERQP